MFLPHPLPPANSPFLARARVGLSPVLASELLCAGCLQEGCVGFLSVLWWGREGERVSPVLPCLGWYKAAQVLELASLGAINGGELKTGHSRSFNCLDCFL